MARTLALTLSTIAVVAGACAKAESGPDARVLARQMKAKLTLPHRIDDATRLDDVEGVSRRVLGYFLTLTQVTAADPGARALAADLERGLRDQACRDQSYTALLKAGISLQMRYRTVDAVELARVEIAPGACGF